MGTKRPLALVSGANRGIGLAITTGLARKGVHVLLGCRNFDQGEEAAVALRPEGLQVWPVQLDTTDDASVAALAARITRDFGHLDILINNAGIGLDYDPSLSVVQRMERTLAVNVVGTVRLIEAMVPLLEKSDRARIVNVSSVLGSFGLRADPSWAFADTKMPTYQASKAALNSLTLSYADRLAEKGIKVNAICPGYTATAATNYAGSRTPEQAAVVAITFALIDGAGPTGSFADDSGNLPW
ncbi:SDR family oxidoreductase [Rhodoplanes sp. SY1]|uniref:SDR family oxidoreductase n=1 Tax=Rhodoplanes sp. SY1 TaxID=3166646 RepID=UPI0038B491FE